MNNGRHDELIKEWLANDKPPAQCLSDGGEWVDETPPGWREDSAYRLFYPPTQTLDEMIARLQKLRSIIGKDVAVFVDGWNDTGIVKPYGPLIIYAEKTKFPDDGEVIRAWEKSDSGEPAVLIA